MINPEDEKQTLYPISTLINGLGTRMGSDVGFLGPSLNQTCSNESVLPTIVEARKVYKTMAGFLSGIGQKLPKKN